ncbi:hypothetical protein ACH5RR_016273 [Cinchona calisaya]|uniref:Aspartic proteinase Asp1 n=1 Tax=Cinchona calisaya TaxID=153742 RepID=A0ABD2ZVI9_9GENT
MRELTLLVLGREMRERKAILMMIFFFGITLSVGAANDRQQKWWTWRSTATTGATSSDVNPAASSIVLPLYGNVYPNGFYFVQVNLGLPSKPYFLDPDTGSDLTWVQCDAPCVHCTKAPHPPYRPTNDLVACKDPLCASLHSGDYECDNPGQCDYEVEYADGGSSLGVLVKDAFSLNLTSGIRLSPRLAFGCGYDQLAGASSHPLDGILGLGKGKSSILSQLHNQGLVRNVVGHCLSGKGGGFLFFGDELYDSSRVYWTPMSQDSAKHYAAGSAEFTLGGKGMGFKNVVVVFDSGSSYTYLNSQTYQSLVSWVRKELHGKPLREVKDDDTLPLCWKGRKPFKSVVDARQYFKPLGLSFDNGWRAKTQFEIPPEAYLIISSKGSVCLGILNGTEIGLQNDNIIGDISMQDKMLIYDNEKKAIGWIPANCNQPPKSNTLIIFSALSTLIPIRPPPPPPQPPPSAAHHHPNPSSGRPSTPKSQNSQSPATLFLASSAPDSSFMLRNSFLLWSGVYPVKVPVQQQPIIICNKRNRSIKAAANTANSTSTNAAAGLGISSTSSPSLFPIFQNPLAPEPTPASELELADPDFYKIGYVRSVRAYGVGFREGPDGFGVYASKDVEPLRRARVIMEIPLELMLTISQKLPWMFFPDIIPVGHPIFDIINSTNPETDWDLRLACLLLYAFDCKDNFWQLYGDFLPSADECTSLLLATEEDLLELQDEHLASTMREQQQRALEFWEKNWHSGVPLKIKRLAREPERFIWAVSMAQSRCVNMQIRIGALVQDSNMLVPYADMLNHSFQPNCFFHWRFKDRMLEVMINAGQRIKRGDEMTVNYMNRWKNNLFMQSYGFSSPVNPWDVIQFSGSARIHLDSFLSVFNISGLPDEYYYNSQLSNNGDNFVDGAVLAAARTLPTWSDGDVPPLPSIERKAAKELQEECQLMLAEYPTTAQQDQQILDSMPEARRTHEAAIKYRLHRKLLIVKVIQALDIYQEQILF